MREMTIPESGAKRKLLDAAEFLFASHGFETVSVRDVSQRVKMNVASVNYHFGSRAGLLATVILRYATPLHEQRLAGLEIAERKGPGKTTHLEAILEAFLQPVLLKAESPGFPEANFHQLLGRILADHGSSLPRPYQDSFQQVNERFMRAFAKVLPDLAADDLAARFHFIQGSLIHLLGQQAALLQISKSPPAMEQSLIRLVKFAAVGLRDGVQLEIVAAAEEPPQAMFDF